MNVFTILALAALSSAAPAYDNAAVRSSSILQQIQQLNEDGSFTFGYENSDGSYRMENRDASGYVVGRYGYIDAYGKTQEMDYVSGNLGGVSVGHQMRGSLVPRTSLDTPFPVVRTSNQIARDLEYMSVDANNDGFPDNAVAIASRNVDAYGTPTTAIVRNVAVETAPVYNSPSVVRTIESAPAYSSPTVVRTVEAAPAYSPATTVVRTVESAPTYSSSSSSAVRTFDTVAALPETQVVTTSIQPQQQVRLVSAVADQPAAAVSVVQSNPNVVRFAVAPTSTVVETPVQQQQVQVLERFVLPQQQQRQAIYQDGQSVFRSPTVGSYGEQNFVVSRSQPTGISYGSSSHLDSFLRNLVVGRSSNGYGQQQQQFQVIGNGLANLGSTASAAAVFQQDDVINIDSFGRII